MILKSHLCGIAVTFDRFDANDIREPESLKIQTEFSTNKSLENGRPQGSLYSQQKRKIADACEWMRLNATNKPIIFVATSPGFTDLASEGKLIQKLTHNLRNGYDCKNYVWVREFTQAGYPHFHFVADMPRFDIGGLTQYWSSLFNCTATNSVRLGTAPNKFGKRNYYLTGKRMCWYLTKYLGKGIGDCEKGAMKGKRSFRTFAVSQELSKHSAPTEFKGQMKRTGKIFQAFTVSGQYVPFHEDERIWQNCTSYLTDQDVRSRWRWKYTGFSNTFKGYPKEWKFKPKQDEQPKAEQPAQIDCPF